MFLGWPLWVFHHCRYISEHVSVDWESHVSGALHSLTRSIWSYFLWHFSYPVLEIRCKLFSIFSSYSFIHFHLACCSVSLLLLNNRLLISSFYRKWYTNGPARSSIDLTSWRLLCLTLVKLVNSDVLHLPCATYVGNTT